MRTTNSKPPGPIIMIDQSEILSRSQVQFITLFLGSAQLCVAPFTSQGKLLEFGAKKPISCVKPAYLDFSAMDLTVWSDTY
jgi:hypothetical protein